MEKEALINHLSQGKSIRKISKDTGKSVGSIRYWLKKYELIPANRPYNRKYHDEHDKELKRIYHNQSTTRCNRKRAIERKQEILNTLFDGGCCLCGYNKCLQAIEFHHINPKLKSFSLDIRKLRQVTYEAVLEEAKKCVALCANCHREVHHGAASLDEYLKNKKR